MVGALCFDPRGNGDLCGRIQRRRVGDLNTLAQHVNEKRLLDESGLERRAALDNAIVVADSAHGIPIRRPVDRQVLLNTEARILRHCLAPRRTASVQQRNVVKRDPPVPPDTGACVYQDSHGVRIVY